jgi:hypothetical protein
MRIKAQRVSNLKWQLVQCDKQPLKYLDRNEPQCVLNAADKNHLMG